MIPIILIYAILINIVGLYVMYSDKRKAKRRQYRISEASLWRIAIFGGAIGTALGMYWFRHKTKHVAFKLGFPTLAVIDIFLLFVVCFGRH